MTQPLFYLEDFLVSKSNFHRKLRVAGCGLRLLSVLEKHKTRHLSVLEKQKTCHLSVLAQK